MATLYLLQYNNYFNRTIKKYNTIQEYLDNETLVNYIQNATLFNPNDGVNATLTTPLQTYGGIDYVVATKDNIIISRWFVIEATRLQGGQYKLSLKRDVIADNFDEIINNADCYIKRGWCDVSNSAIYNDESITFNQIKKSQTEMYDKSCTSWIVGYIVPPESSTTISFKFNNKLYKVDINNNIQKVEDANYAIFYMPYNTFDFYYSDTTFITQSAALSKKVANEISREFSSGGVLLDLQILPYCPVNSILKDGFRKGYVPTFNVPIKHVQIITDEGETEGFMGLCTVSSTSGDIYTYKTDSLGVISTELLKITVNDIKKESVTTKARMVSPNGNGVWEFVPAKQVEANNTSKQFSFTMTAMPYQPYIKVEPSFGRLYGGNYNDTRGLICGGDFAMPQINDQWKAYQIQNKNYQNMFNRQIESLDLQQKWAAKQDEFNAFAGTAQGAIGGAMGGSIIGGGSGGMIGMGVGTGLSYAAGQLDLEANAELRADKRSATVELHNMTLQNIQALPISITKATNFNAEQPKVPYLEIYSCTNDELTNLDNYLKLYSYTINRMGKIKNYIEKNNQTFIRATLIRDEGIKDDSHLLADISQELSQGVYIGG